MADSQMEEPLLCVLPSTSLAEEAIQNLVEQIEERAGGLTSLLLQVQFLELLRRL